MAGHGAGREAREIQRLFRRRILVDPLEFSPQRGDFHIFARVTYLRASSRFCRTRHALQNFAGGSLCHPIHFHHVDLEFPPQSLRKFLSRTCIRFSDANVCPVVPRTVDQPGRDAGGRRNCADRALCGFPPRFADLVDLGHNRGRHPYIHRRLYFATLRRAALQHV